VSVRAVLFDAGNTLLFLDYGRLAAGVTPVAGMRLTAAGLAAAAGPAAREVEGGAASERERAARYLDALFRLAGVARERLRDVAAALRRLHHERHLWSGVAPRTVEALRRLRAAGLRLGVVSNSDGGVEEALTAAGLRSSFDVVVDSASAGVEKPDPRIFRVALAALGVAPAEALYMGDIYDVDVAGARAAGLRAALVGPSGSHAPDDVTVAPSVAELIELLVRRGELSLDPVGTRDSSR
jgi:HAD superfamily hydrolase (TIGR01509 family)